MTEMQQGLQQLTCPIVFNAAASSLSGPLNDPRGPENDPSKRLNLAYVGPPSLWLLTVCKKELRPRPCPGSACTSKPREKGPKLDCVCVCESMCPRKP